MSFTNPIIPGFYPDPSVCRVGEDYYLVTSSFQYFPGVPVFHSRDLIHWEQIGHCLTRRSQLPLDKAGCSAGIYAPTIRYHNNLFYMVTTNVSENKHLIVTASDPAGEWSDPIKIEHGHIDPSLFFDDDGTVYFTSNGPGIRQSVVDLEKRCLVGESKLIWKGTGGKVPEAPHLYKINGMYYLMIAEGGTEYGHMETIARSKSPWGPFDPCPHNPILSNRSKGRPLQCTGHGDLIEDHTGAWWMVFLATRGVGYPPAQHLGRETCLTPITWDSDGWPVVSEDASVVAEIDCPTLPQTAPKPHKQRDDFDSNTLGFEWNFLRNPYEKDWSLLERPGFLRLKGSAVTLSEIDSPAFVGRRQQHHDCVVTARLDFSPAAENEEAGITVYMNARHHYEIARKGNSVLVRRQIGSLSVVVASVPVPDEPLELSIEAEKELYTFKVNGKEIASGETRYLAAEIAGGFTGVYIGLYATGNGQPSDTPADFDWFDYVITQSESA